LAFEILMTVMLVLLIVAGVVARIVLPGSFAAQALPLAALAVLLIWQVAYRLANRRKPGAGPS
jgi:membrane protein implicated in regulation of membrane protease activity